MPKFVLIDHSLKDLGGHYYTYASCVLPAAERAGYQVVLAVNREFRDFAALPRSWGAHAIYKRKSHSHRTIEAGGHRAGTLGALTSWWIQMRKALRARERERIAKSFAEDCAALFERVPLAAGDHVFIATASELDVGGLARFLQSRSMPGTANYGDVDWHLQFHLGPFKGREPDYPAQDAAREAMREVFVEALARVPGHRIHLYCTNEQLTAQYERLLAAPFSTLPYPVHPLFLEKPPSHSAAPPVRIACLGHNRREKGYRQLPRIVAALWQDYLSQGRAQLVMQTRRRDLQRPLDAVVAKLGAHSATPPVEYASFPLELERYAALLRSSGIGLLLYDSARYYARASGVMLEMLTTGVPVVVPAGCWLSEQIAEETQSYLDDVAADTQPLRHIDFQEVSWQPAADTVTVNTAARTVSFGRTALTGEFALPSGAASVLVSLDWMAPPTPGTYLQLCLEQFDAQGLLLNKFAIANGQRAQGRKLHALFHLKKEARRARLAWSNAWDDATITAGGIECRVLGGESRPLGAVGLSAAVMEQTPELLLDILRHLEHYRRSAAAFATRCARHHNAEQIVALLTGVPAVRHPR